jgi:hypothetical protein
MPTAGHVVHAFRGLLDRRRGIFHASGEFLDLPDGERRGFFEFLNELR